MSNMNDKKDNNDLNLEALKELNDLEFEIVFVDTVYKKIKQVDKPDIRTSTLLFIYMSIVESLKKYEALAIETGRTIPYKDMIDIIIAKGEHYLISVCDEEAKANYVQQSLRTLYDLTYNLMTLLKSELIATPKYEHLKPDS